MSLDDCTRQQLWTLLHAVGSSVDINSALAKVCNEFNVKPNDDIKAVIKIQLRSFNKKFNKKRPSIAPEAPSDELLFDTIQFENADSPPIVDEEEPMDLDPVSEMRTPFRLLSPRVKRARTQEIYDMLDSFVQRENETFPDQQLTTTNLLGYLLQRSNYRVDREITLLGTKVCLHFSFYY